MIACDKFTQKIVVEGVNRVTKHTRVGTTNRGAKSGGIEHIEAAINALDAIEGDADFEPSLGSTGGWGDQTYWIEAGPTDDREWECEDEGAQVDAEPDGGGEGTSNRLWEIAGREMWRVDGANHEPVDLDELPETLEASFERPGVFGG